MLIGCDVTKIDQESLDILTNMEVIAVSQDPLGKQGTKVWANNTLMVAFLTLQHTHAQATAILTF